MIEWREIGGFEGLYKVSNTGDVFSLPKVVKVGGNGGTTMRGGILLKQTPLKNGGHLRVFLADGSGTKKSLLVHRLVAGAFLPNPQSHPVINHIDQNPTNNTTANLEWCTVAHNNENCTRSVGNQRGNANSQAKLTDEQVLKIRQRYAQTGNASLVAREFGLNPRHCLHIIKRTMWAHI